MESATGLIIAILLIVLWLGYTKHENYTVEERVAILEKRVNDLYSGGASARHLVVPTSTNQ
jgi:hypothetical protein